MGRPDAYPARSSRTYSERMIVYPTRLSLTNSLAKVRNNPYVIAERNPD
jgi:hypothetical protein